MESCKTMCLISLVYLKDSYIHIDMSSLLPNNPLQEGGLLAFRPGRRQDDTLDMPDLATTGVSETAILSAPGLNNRRPETWIRTCKRDGGVAIILSP
jgi:hypothetical protein